MKENLKYPLAIKRNYFYIQLIERFTSLVKNGINCLISANRAVTDCWN